MICFPHLADRLFSLSFSFTAPIPPTNSDPKPVSGSLSSAGELGPDEDWKAGVGKGDRAIGVDLLGNKAIVGDLLGKRSPRLASLFNLASSDPWDQFPIQKWDERRKARA